MAAKTQILGKQHKSSLYAALIQSHLDSCDLGNKRPQENHSQLI